MPASTQGIKYPKLRTRQQITLRYKLVEQELDYWRARSEHAGMDMPRVAAKIEQHITECEAQLDALLYALNDVV